MSEQPNHFTKDNLDTYLKALAKEYKKRNRNAPPAEIILVGGAAILTNYGFRNTTTDVDAIIHATSAMKDSINHVGDTFNLPNNWLNTDFTHTSSYSPKLSEISTYYKTFSNILQVRTISAEYLVAMKLCSGRKYKNDLSDIIGILAEHEKRGAPITMDAINNAVLSLYSDWKKISTESLTFITNALQNKNYQNLYSTVNREEILSQKLLVQFNHDYPNTTNPSNVNEILHSLKSKQP